MDIEKNRAIKFEVFNEIAKLKDIITALKIANTEKDLIISKICSCKEKYVHEKWEYDSAWEKLYKRENGGHRILIGTLFGPDSFKNGNLIVDLINKHHLGGV